MAKRSRDSDDGSPHSKRQRITADGVVKVVPTKIQSLKDLQQLLAFEQDAGPQVKQNIQLFKIFLDSIAYGEDNEDRSTKRSILFRYLKSQVLPEGSTDTVYLADIVQTWSFSTQSNNEGLFSAVTAVLALLLKAISSFVDFRDYGNLLCRTVLHIEQLKLIDRGLSANKPKEHIISPCLRLLTEVVSFDGGNAAKSVYLHRDITFRRLDTFLNMRKDSLKRASDDQWRPSVRNNALRFLFANLRLQDRTAKIDILSQARLVRAIFQDIREDSPPTVHDILNALRKDIVQDDELPRATKSRVFSDWVLGRLATLYGYRQNDEFSEGRETIEIIAHGFLIFLCTNVKYGVLLAQNSWFSMSGDAAKADIDTESIHSTPIYLDNYHKRRPVQNKTLASFLLVLRPYANLLQSDLLVAVFRAAPELVADYFDKNKSFSFEPKLTTTWIGYSTFLLSTMQLPVPGQDFYATANGIIPPPVSIMMESILPQPLSQKALTRCLNQNANLITFFATRILIAAFKKLAEILNFMEIAGQMQKNPHRDLWDQAASKLVVAFSRRCPEMKHVITVFRSSARESVMLREAVARLLAMYYKVIPQVALNDKLDISVPLSLALKDNERVVKGLNIENMQLLELDHLLEIAYRAPDMRWWQKPDNLPFSPFTTVLKLHVTSLRLDVNDPVRALLRSLGKDSALLRPDTQVVSIDVLVLSLRTTQEWVASNSLYSFLDNCILRFVRKPVKYYDNLTSLLAAAPEGIDTTNVDLLLITILEQWHFYLTTAAPAAVRNVAEWLVRYLDFLMRCGCNFIVLSQIRDSLAAEVKDEDCHALLQNALKNSTESSIDELKDKYESMSEMQVKAVTLHTPADDLVLTGPAMPPPPPEEDENHLGLNKWTLRNVPDAVGDGSVAELILCLCSEHQDIRKQALVGLRTLVQKIKASEYQEWLQTYLLVGEVIETVKEIPSEISLPYFAGILAAYSVLVLADPLHFMYTKINKFLNRRPQWKVAKLPSYWVDRILLHPPTDDDGHYQEVEWLLDALIEGLRTPADFEIYRQCHILERLLSMSPSSSLPESCSEKIVNLLFRCTYVGGSSTLLTRCGLLSWINSRLGTYSLSFSDRKLLSQLAMRAYETSDKERIDEWSGESFTAVLGRLKPES